MLREYLDLHPNEFASAIRGPYNHATYRTGGFVWFKSKIPQLYSQESSPWVKPLLKHMLLHELGHVFGMPHDSVYVMAEKTGQDIAEMATRGGNSDPANYLQFGTIESPDWHYRYIVGDTVNLCKYGGGLFQIPVGSCWNGHLPTEIRSTSGIDGEGHHKRIVRIVSKDLIEIQINAVNADGRNVDFTIDIPIEGNIWKPVWQKGPGVYTLWKDVTGQPMYQRAGIDFDSAILPLRGTAKVADSAYGLIWNQGSGGAMYIPQAQAWWDFTSLYY